MAHEVKSPMPGTVLRAPSPNGPPFETIDFGAGMKPCHEVRSDGEGTIDPFAVKDDTAITAGRLGAARH